MSLEKPHPTCIKCQHNKFPLCYIQKIDNEYARIDNLRTNFKCGLKEETVIQYDWVSLNPPDYKSEKERIAELEAEITTMKEDIEELKTAQVVTSQIMTDDDDKIDIPIIIEKSTTFLERLRGFITKKEPLTKKLEVALTGCTNGNRGLVVKAVCDHDLRENRIGYAFILMGITIAVILPLGLNFLFDWLRNV